MMARFPAGVLLAAGAVGALAVGLAASAGSTLDCAGQPYAEALVPGRPRLRLEVAATAEEQERGLMFRESLPEDVGMLFVFDRVRSGPFWNLNTLIPLSLAYLAPDGTIVDLHDMQPFLSDRSPEIYPSARPYLYGLEANRGWFTRHGVKVGDRLALCLSPR